MFKNMITRRDDAVEAVKKNNGPGTRSHHEDTRSPYVKRRAGAAVLAVVGLPLVAEATDYGDRIPIVHEVKQGAISLFNYADKNIEEQQEHLNGPHTDTPPHQDIDPAEIQDVYEQLHGDQVDQQP